MLNTVKIGRQKSSATCFAFDDCHKIYLCEDLKDIKKAKSYGYEIYAISGLKDAWEDSCPLRFINNFKLDKTYIQQGRDAKITILDKGE